MFSRNRGGNPNITKRGRSPFGRDQDQSPSRQYSQVCPDGSRPDPVTGMCGGDSRMTRVCPDGSDPDPVYGCRPMGMRKGGKAESKAMMKKEVAFMKKKGAPKSMIRHEQREMSDKMGRALKKKGAAGRAMKFSGGGSASSRADGVATRGKTKGKMVKMMKGGYCG